MEKTCMSKARSPLNDKAGPARKKRKRQEKLQKYGVDLPEIPGVPVQVIPLLVYALKAATKYFQYEDRIAYNEEYAENIYESEYLEARSTLGGRNGSSALENVLDRLDSTARESQEDQQQNCRKTKMKDSVQSWLQAVKRTLSSPGAEAPSSDNAPYRGSSVPLSCFLYIWNIGKEHKRLAVRRAALLLARHLLDKNAESRRVLLQDNIDELLWEWMNIVSKGETEFDSAKQRLWQREAHFLLAHLKDKHYGDHYPKLIVAERYLREACDLQADVTQVGGEGVDYNNNNLSMTMLRNLRDIALDHGTDEIKRMSQLILRAKSCMDILVPRLEGDKNPNPGFQQHTEVERATKSGKGGDGTVSQLDISISAEGAVEDEEDVEIDWEDGWDNSEDEGQDCGRNSESHSQAVERTLMVMESMGGFSKIGGLEINFSRTDPDPPIGNAAPMPSDENVFQARSRLRKCVRILSTRHLRRIRLWMEGLTKADRLHSPSEQSSLILIPKERSRYREELQDTLSDLTSQMRIVLESAARLGIQSETNCK